MTRTNETVTMVRLGSVVVDPSYQTRMKLNPQFINIYAEAMALGSVFPPIVVEEETRKLVCGFTRMPSYRKVFEPDHLIPAIVRSFDDEYHRMRYSLHDNSKHGQPMESFDIKNAISKLRPSGITDEELSAVFGISTTRVRKLAGQLVDVVGTVPRFVEERFDTPQAQETAFVVPPVTDEEQSEEQTTEGQEEQPQYVRIVKTMPLKHGLRHLVGTQITREVYENIENHYMPHYVVTLCDQIIMRIDDDTINTESEAEVATLRILCDKIGAFLGKLDEQS